VLVTPLIDLGSRQADWLRGAKRLGIRTGFPVFSWDNLTNKGLVRDEPDLTLVWNDLQAREAEELHGISPARIRITGRPAAEPALCGARRCPAGGETGGGADAARSSAPRSGSTRRSRSSSTCAPRSSSRRTRS